MCKPQHDIQVLQQKAGVLAHHQQADGHGHARSQPPLRPGLGLGTNLFLLVGHLAGGQALVGGGVDVADAPCGKECVLIL